MGEKYESTAHLTGVGAGIVFCSIIVSTMAMYGFSWNNLWFGAALLALLLAIPVILLTPREIGIDKASYGKRESNNTIGFIFITLGYGLFGFGYVILATFISTMARAVPEMSTTEPYIWLLVGLSGIPTVIFWSWLGKLFGNDLALAIACGIETFGVYISAALSSEIGIILGSSLEVHPQV